MIRGRYLPRLNRDETLVIAASAVRAMDYGFLAVFLGVYLGLLGYTVFEAGLVFSSIMAGGALSNIVVAWRGDAIGRKRMLVFMSGLMVLGGVLYPFVTASWLLVLIGLFAMTSSTGGDRTAFLSVDMAILSQTSSVSRRTVVFGWYDVIGLGAKALGTLLIAVPPLLQSQLDMGEIASFKAMFGVYCVIAFAGMLLYGQLSPHAEATQPDDPSDRRMSKGSRNLILRLTALFSLDAMGGGFMVRGFISYWFVSRFGISPTSVAGIFFTGQMLTAVSVMLAASVASRIGLINTVVLTQFVSNLFMVAMALTGNLWAAIAMFWGRELANDMDVPTRQSYTMAIVPPEARTATAGVTNLGRNLAQTVSPGVGGYVAQITFLGAPLLIGSGIKLVYDAALYVSFRNVKAAGRSRYGGCGPA